jgi:hypothetical protein
MRRASLLLQPANYQVGASAGQQHNLTVSALDEVNATAGIQGN